MVLLCYRDKEYIMRMLRKGSFLRRVFTVFCMIFTIIIFLIFISIDFPNKFRSFFIICAFTAVFWVFYFKLYHYYFVKVVTDITICDDYIVVKTFSKKIKLLNKCTYLKNTFFGNSIMIYAMINGKKNYFYILKEKQEGLRKLDNINYNYLSGIFINYCLK